MQQEFVAGSLPKVGLSQVCGVFIYTPYGNMEIACIPIINYYDCTDVMHMINAAHTNMMRHYMHVMTQLCKLID